jgi:hypothetical protein
MTSGKKNSTSSDIGRSINISDCLKSPGTGDSSPRITTCKTKTDKNNTCKTCVMLITSPEFTSNLTGKTYYTKSFEPLDCSTKNVNLRQSEILIEQDFKI